MIDLHCHILPGVDDGPATLDDALAMVTMAERDGTRVIVSTPHLLPPGPEGTCEHRDRVLAELGEAISRRGLGIRVLPGFECHVVESLVAEAKAGAPWFLGGSRTLLVEVPATISPFVVLPQLCFEAALARIILVLAHPECHPSVQRRPGQLVDLLERGLKLQVTANSLSWRLGWRPYWTARRLLRAGWVTAVATDAHDASRRAPLLSRARRTAHRWLGEAADRLFTDNPRQLLGL